MRAASAHGCRSAISPSSLCSVSSAAAPADDEAAAEDEEETDAFCFSLGTSLGAAGNGGALDDKAEADAEAEAVGEITTDEDTGRRPIGDCERGDDVPLLLLIPPPTLMGRVSAKRLDELSSLALPESRADDDDDDADDDEEPPPLMSSCVVSPVL